MVSRSELVDEIKTGSQAIADALERFGNERELYIASVGWATYDTSNGTSTSCLIRGQWKIRGSKTPGAKNYDIILVSRHPSTAREPSLTYVRWY